MSRPVLLLLMDPGIPPEQAMSIRDRLAAEIGMATIGTWGDL